MTFPFVSYLCYNEFYNCTCNLLTFPFRRTLSAAYGAERHAFLHKTNALAQQIRLRSFTNPFGTACRKSRSSDHNGKNWRILYSTWRRAASAGTRQDRQRLEVWVRRCDRAADGDDGGAGGGSGGDVWAVCWINIDTASRSSSICIGFTPAICIL